MDQPGPVEVFLHIKVVLGMIISLSLARLLTGLAAIVQHPDRNRIYAVHLGWALSLFLFIIHFWWWEHRLQSLAVIGFGTYLFLVCFCCLFFFLCALLFPSSVDDYGGYEEYFMSRRKWFFGLLALAYALDLADTTIKGKDYFLSFGWEYPLRNLAFVLLCITAAISANRRFHALFVGLGLLYQVSWIFRLYDLLA
ncbi:hypothetical protein MRS76_23610 [Rhizobiaceae bacterium n13]|uniref:Uncharacterized protein n=1 Tax=Ferirhizobium litorale TaxID=2927786 RepID=A0AAE3QKX2_9HYPH|nr:hypothetical protein [Fererhizobium litorale]MDI7864919.1 hypothetical protein [Fererhizobium litorale]MDI7925039.1 hypothetical protein [Fererhizobium litorale]